MLALPCEGRYMQTCYLQIYLFKHDCISCNDDAATVSNVSVRASMLSTITAYSALFPYFLIFGTFCV
jgi:hypothetical protein